MVCCQYPSFFLWQWSSGMASSIPSAPAPISFSTASGGAASAAPQDATTATAWLLLSLRKDLDLNGDGQLSFEEFSQNKTSGNISAENQSILAQIDQAAFDAIEQTDGAGNGSIDFGVLAGNQYLVNQIARYGNPVPSDFLLASLSASGQIADPNALTLDEQKKLADLEQKLCTSGFDSLTPDEQTVVQRAATNLLRLDSSLGGLAAGTAPMAEQLSTAITTLTNRIGYETGHTPVASGVDPKNYDTLSLLAGGTGSDQLSTWAYNSVANQVKADTTGSLGQTDKIGTIYLPHLQQEEDSQAYTDVSDWGGPVSPPQTKPLSTEQQAFVADWMRTNGPITAENKESLNQALSEKFPPEAGWSFQEKEVADPWVGQRENVGTLQDQETKAYREWNADGTPKVASATHRAQALTQELQAFVGAATTLNDPKAWASMDYLEGKDHDWQNDNVGDIGLSQLAGLTPDSPQWDQLAADRSDRAVPYEERKKYIDAAKVATSPEQTSNLTALRSLGADAGFYNKEDWKNWLDVQAVVAPYAQLSQIPSAAQQDFTLAVGELNNPSAWALMDLLEPGTDMTNDLVGDLGLGKLAQLTPESAQWDQLPTDKAVPDKAQRQAMIGAAQLIMSPEQTPNRVALKAAGANADLYNKEDWQAWLDAQPPALYDLNHYLGRLGQAGGTILQPIQVDRDHMSKGLSIVAGILSLGWSEVGYTGTHKPNYSDEQQFVYDQLQAQGRDPAVLDKAMEDAHEEWVDAMWQSAGWAVIGVATAFIPGIGVAGGAVSRAAATAARVGESALGATGRVVGGAVGAMVSVVDQATIGGLGNLFTTLGAKVPTAVKAAWDKFVQRAGEGASTQELTPLLTTAREGLESLETAGQLTAEQTSQRQQLRSLEAQLKRASEAEAALAAPSKQLAPAPAPTANTASPLPAPAAAPTPKLPAELADQALAGVTWRNPSQTRGQVSVNGQRFDVVKTTEGQVLTGKFEQGGSRFKAFDASTGRPTGALFYKSDDGSGWFRGGLMGGAQHNDGAGPSAANQNQNVNTVVGHEGGSSAGGADSAPGTPTKPAKEDIKYKNSGSGLSKEDIESIDGDINTGDATIKIGKNKTYNVIRIGDEIFLCSKENGVITLKKRGKQRNQVEDLKTTRSKKNVLVKFEEGKPSGDSIVSFNNFNKSFGLNCSFSEFVKLDMPPSAGDTVLRAARGGDGQIYYLVDGKTTLTGENSYGADYGIEHILYGSDRESLGHIKEFIKTHGEAWFPELHLGSPTRDPAENSFWWHIKARLNQDDPGKWTRDFEKFKNSSDWYKAYNSIANSSLSRILEENVVDFRERFIQGFWNDIVMPEIRKKPDPTKPLSPTQNQGQAQKEISVYFLPNNSLSTAYVPHLSHQAQVGTSGYSPLPPKGTPGHRKEIKQDGAKPKKAGRKLDL